MSIYILTDRSGTITSGGTAQQVVAASTDRRYLLIQNLSTENLWVNFAGTATPGGGSILILANGGSVVAEGTFIPHSAVSIYGATTGSAFTAYER